jgi:hypothetical protein
VSPARRRSMYVGVGAVSTGIPGPVFVLAGGVLIEA